MSTLGNALKAVAIAGALLAASAASAGDVTSDRQQRSLQAQPLAADRQAQAAPADRGTARPAVASLCGCQAMAPKDPRGAASHMQ